PVQTVSGWATNISAGAPNETSQKLNFLVSNNNTALFSQQPAVDAATGNLACQAAKFASGDATVTVALHDDGGTANGGPDTPATETFKIHITLINQAPSFTSGGDVNLLENTGSQPLQNVAWAKNVSAGPPNESGQTLNFVVQSNSNPSLFSTAPSIAA